MGGGGRKERCETLEGTELLCSINHESCCDVNAVLSVYWSSDIEQIAVDCIDHIRCTDIDPDAGKK